MPLKKINKSQMRNKNALQEKRQINYSLATNNKTMIIGNQK